MMLSEDLEGRISDFMHISLLMLKCSLLGHSESCV
jgi:hypothetical protein